MSMATHASTGPNNTPSHASVASPALHTPVERVEPQPWHEERRQRFIEGIRDASGALSEQHAQLKNDAAAVGAAVMRVGEGAGQAVGAAGRMTGNVIGTLLQGLGSGVQLSAGVLQAAQNVGLQQPADSNFGADANMPPANDAPPQASVAAP